METKRPSTDQLHRQIRRMYDQGYRYWVEFSEVPPLPLFVKTLPEIVGLFPEYKRKVWVILNRDTADKGVIKDFYDPMNLEAMQRGETEVGSLYHSLHNKDTH